MKFELSKKQIDKLKSQIQDIIESELDTIRQESEDWGLGEIHELEQLNSVIRIEVDRIVPYTGLKVYVVIYSTNEEDYDYSDLRSELQYRVEQWIPNVKLFIDNVI